MQDFIRKFEEKMQGGKSVDTDSVEESKINGKSVTDDSSDDIDSIDDSIDSQM